MRDLGGLELRVGGHEHRPGARRAEQQRDALDRLGQPRDDAVAWLHAVPDQAPRDTRDQRVEFAERQRAVAVDERRCVGGRGGDRAVDADCGFHERFAWPRGATIWRACPEAAPHWPPAGVTLTMATRAAMPLSAAPHPLALDPDAGSTLAAVRTLLAAELGLSAAAAARLHSGSALFGDLPELDSMAVARVLTAIEDRFGIVVDDDEVDGDLFGTLGSLTAFVERKRGSLTRGVREA